jgi:hypothetical protein
VAGAIVLGGAFQGPTQFGTGGSASAILSLGDLLVTGGTIQGGAVSVPDGTLQGNSGAGVLAQGGTVTIAGGQLRGGAAPIGVVPLGGLDSTVATVTIRGGTIDVARGTQSRVIVLGGDLGELRLDPIQFVQPIPGPNGGSLGYGLVTRPSCGELRGGTVRDAIGVVSSDLWVFGSRFNLPFGQVQVQTSPVRLTGELADGSAIDVALFNSGRTFLVPTPAPGSPAATPGSMCPLSVIGLPDS